MGIASRLGFRGRLITAMIALVVLVSVVVVAMLMVYLFEDEKSRALEQLTIGERLTTEVMARRTDLELSRLSVIVQDFGFRSAVASQDTSTMISALENHGHRAGADFAVLLDSQGSRLASTLNQPIQALSQETLITARTSGFARVLRVIGGQGFELLVIPVEAPGLRAWLVAGFAMGQPLAESITRLSGTSVIFRARRGEETRFHTFASTAPDDNGRMAELSQATATQGFIGSADYFTRVINLQDSQDDSIQSVLLISREASLQRYYRRTAEIASLVTAILLLAIVLALVIARTLGRPVLALADYARTIGEGDSPLPPAIRAGGELTQLRDALGDMQQRLRAREAQIRYAATHDEVTGMANRNALMQAAASLFRERAQATLIGIRLNELSNLNDTLGIEFGDKILIGIASRMSEQLPDCQLIARTGGGEFLVLAPSMSCETVRQRVEALHSHLESPLYIDGTPFSLRLTVITMALPEDASDLNALRRRVNLTFEQAQTQPQGQSFTRYQPGQDETHLRELKLTTDLHTAILNSGLHMNYQPKLDSSTGKLVQVEALVRWCHPELGFISPEEFIFLAEQSGQIQSLTAHILRRVAEDARQWRRQGLDTGIAINLSAMDLTWPHLTDYIAATFQDWHGEMERITLEVTESAIMEEPEKAMATLDKLRALGLTLSVDDFGTGYSSLSQLRRLPVKELKIDKSFVLNLDSEPQDQLIVRSTIEMAHGLGLKVVAEGIENLRAWRLLQQWGCNLGQGFFLSRPIPPDDLPTIALMLEMRVPELTKSDAEYS